MAKNYYQCAQLFRKEKCGPASAWELASLRLIKKMRGGRVCVNRGDYLRTYALMASFNKNYRPNNFTVVAV